MRQKIQTPIDPHTLVDQYYKERINTIRVFVKIKQTKDIIYQKVEYRLDLPTMQKPKYNIRPTTEYAGEKVLVLAPNIEYGPVRPKSGVNHFMIIAISITLTITITTTMQNRGAPRPRPASVPSFTTNSTRRGKFL